MRAESGLIEVGVLVALIEYVILTLISIQQFAAFITVLPRAKVSLDRVGEVLATAEPVRIPATGGDESVRQDSPSGIEIEQLTFRYPGASLPVIDELSLAIRPGTTSAIIGSTGSGKTTLLRLLIRDYDPTRGSIRIDGRDFRDLTRNDFNRLFTIVPQQTFLFSDSIRENIRAGKPDASDEEIWSVLDACQIGFATERKVRQTIQERLAGKTLIIVAQRVATVRHAAEILVMDERAIAGRGSHEALLASSTIYQEIIASQVRGEVS